MPDLSDDLRRAIACAMLAKAVVINRFALHGSGFSLTLTFISFFLEEMLLLRTAQGMLAVVLLLYLYVYFLHRHADRILRTGR